MLNINEEDLKTAIIDKAAEGLIDDEHLSGLVAREVKARIDKIFIERAEAQIASAIDEAISNSFDREYQRITTWGEPAGPKTTIRAELEKTVSGYWSALVDAKTGKPTDSQYGSIKRAEFLMTQICAADFSASLRQAALSVTGALKDGFRNQMGKQMDSLLDELFRIKSLQDQGKVEKPY